MQHASGRACSLRVPDGRGCSRIEGHDGPCAPWDGGSCGERWANSDCDLAAGHRGPHIHRAVAPRAIDGWWSFEWSEN